MIALNGAEDAKGESPGGGRFAVVEAAGYAYHLYVEPEDGWRRRWRGRVVRIDPSGRQQLLPSRHTRSREALIGRLWDETVRDIQSSTARGTPIEVVETT